MDESVTAEGAPGVTGAGRKAGGASAGTLRSSHRRIWGATVVGFMLSRLMETKHLGADTEKARVTTAGFGPRPVAGGAIRQLTIVRQQARREKCLESAAVSVVANVP